MSANQYAFSYDLRWCKDVNCTHTKLTTIYFYFCKAPDFPVFAPVYVMYCSWRLYWLLYSIACPAILLCPIAYQCVCLPFTFATTSMLKCDFPVPLVPQEVMKQWPNTPGHGSSLHAGIIVNEYLDLKWCFIARKIFEDLFSKTR